MNILTVCTGNICRSPLVEHLLTQAFSDLDVSVASAGTRARGGMTMPREAIETAVSLGIARPLDVEHRARLLTPALLDGVDLVLPLAREHRREIVELAPALTRKAFTLREFGRLAAGMSDEELLSGTAASAQDATPTALLEGFLKTLGARRGLIDPPRTPLDDDVIDPFGRSADVYRQTARELEQSVPTVVRVVRLAFAATATTRTPDQ
ncbi:MULTISPECIES: low molecular weight phosphatase family protein [Microbacterium]|uniref:arsenate reductase/protein-tyrosine-phosphatase family protein n=1 Tax=Microbacterium TaxID=33882 RepID=UPI00278915C0|nr:MULTISPECIES: low molecular weight phosphatase family protein [Microbacterium]MDQ1083856.1 protein-tyrosine phosphatase [Microbacterium sp. SORGH_AS_0344]MDQ1170865.1 protein-tyrosine phosphatase [Microbacterium proteolyticum]